MGDKELKKPEKKHRNDYSEDDSLYTGESLPNHIGYNQACDEWEAYHNQQMNTRPSLSVEDLREAILPYCINDNQVNNIALAIKDKIEERL